MIKPVYIVGAARTPTARINTQLGSVPSTKLGSITIREALHRSKVPLDLFSGVYMGQVLQAGAGQAPAKQAAMQAGLAPDIEATTINKVCASGLKAITLAAQDIQLGYAVAQVAGGMESMSNVPMYSKKGDDCSHKEKPVIDGLLLDGLINASDGRSMGACADGVARQMGISREDQDQYALATYTRACRAQQSNTFQEEIVPVLVDGATAEIFDTDSLPHESLFSRLRSLKPVFSPGGTVTAGNACSLSDGGSAVVLVNGQVAKQFCQENRVLAKIVAYADASVAPHEFALAPTKAIQLVLESAQMCAEQISLWEINEAFAIVVIASQLLLGLDPDRINVNGGAIALGHPLGSSGCRILVTLLHQLSHDQYGIAVICNGGGGATAMLIQRVQGKSLDALA
ncbi:Thiolase-like, subgroup [Penicillium expansum]|uniref:Thiolase-like, subgroup n=1 Tax=Penicillium expansum TaxID=27334 RepID=A0A0A2JAE7_PENEN|nr:Thiolase-like, subgroup [Penicillium expansum]KGO43263.1 Thiolase-like, subgroup [Penicillium expansum]KGO52319.1 Thiolase-like, subgroup [Penicillium expansum]KGO57678.1 Thiolase-like, subgroup [Penicillium expansum]